MPAGSARIPLPSGLSFARHVRDEVQRRFDHLMELKPAAGQDVEHAREYVEAMLGLEVWASNLYQAVLAPARAGHDGL